MIAEFYLVMDRAGIFKKAIDEWDKLPMLQKTWALFQTHFKQAYKRHKAKERRATGSSPHQHVMANNAMKTLAGTMERHLDRYANSAAVKTEAISNLTTTNATLVATNAELTTKMETCLSEVMKLMKEVEKFKNQ